MSQHRIRDSNGVEPTPPDHWPTDQGFVLKVDCWRRAAWLPPDYGQGIKETASGKTLQCYITPEGKLYYHKQDLEKYTGVDMSFMDYPPMDGIGRPINFVGNSGNDEDKLTAKIEAPPHWPADVVVDPGKRVVWLPEDWGCGYRRTNSGKPLKVYISPCGKLRFHKSKIMEDFFGGAELPELNLDTNGRGDPMPAQASGKTGGVWVLAEGAASAGSPAAKRPRLQPKLPAGPPREGFSVTGSETSWVVMPDNVISVDLDRLAEKIAGAGWVAAEKEASCRVFSSKLGDKEAKIVLKLAGQLEVEGGAEQDVRDLAKLYVDEWLWEEG